MQALDKFLAGVKEMLKAAPPKEEEKGDMGGGGGEETKEGEEGDTNNLPLSTSTDGENTDPPSPPPHLLEIYCITVGSLPGGYSPFGGNFRVSEMG